MAMQVVQAGPERSHEQNLRWRGIMAGRGRAPFLERQGVKSDVRLPWIYSQKQVWWEVRRATGALLQGEKQML